MINTIDSALSQITMYRLTLYYLIALLFIAALFSLSGTLPFPVLALLFSTFFLVFICLVTNHIFAKVFNAPTNVESAYISALILALIITPIRSFHDLPFLFWAGIWAMASKFILAIKKKHISNPVAFAVALTALTINQTASWWVGNLSLLPFVFLGGLLIARKVQRFRLILSFLAAFAIITLGFSVSGGSYLPATFKHAILLSPLLFFSFVMLTEPLTTPPTKKLQAYYGALVGVLFAPQIHFGSVYFTPELALLAGNIFSYIVSPKEKLLLRLKERINLAPNIYDFVFSTSQKFSFLPGQYMEWTLSHPNPDSRGNRRYFTIASSPTEREVRLGIKFSENSSSFKKSLLSLGAEDEIAASQLAGEFTLPKDPNKKCVFVAGGIGITPFRSMMKFLLDIGQKRPIVLFYASKTESDIIYKDVLDEAHEKLGIKTVYTLTDIENISPKWQGRQGQISDRMIKEEVADYKDCVFYLSGPHSMVVSFKKVLSDMGIKKEQVKVDFFPGFA